MYHGSGIFHGIHDMFGGPEYLEYVVHIQVFGDVRSSSPVWSCPTNKRGVHLKHLRSPQKGTCNAIVFWHKACPGKLNVMMSNSMAVILDLT